MLLDDGGRTLRELRQSHAWLRRHRTDRRAHRAIYSTRPRDLSSLRDSLHRLDPNCARRWQPRRRRHARGTLHAQLTTPALALDLLNRAILPEPAALIRDGGVIANGFDTESRRTAYAERQLRRLSACELEARERARTGIANLKVEYNRVHGFYIEVSKRQRHASVPDDYRRRQTLKNAERYLTPELKAFEDKALSAQDRALGREKLLYEGVLTELAGRSTSSCRQFAQAMASLDLLAGFAASRRNCATTADRSFPRSRDC
jgi:DNA mismatch repair protein MutS